MKKGKFFKTLGVFATCLCAPLLLTGCLEKETRVEFRVHDGWIQITYDGIQWKNAVSIEEINSSQDGKDGNGIKSITIDQAHSDATKTTYIITFDDNTTYTYVVKNGTNGKDGKDGEDGTTPTISISNDGFWIINGVKTDKKAVGTDGSAGKDADVWTIGENGNWFKNGEDTGNKAIGTDGQDGKDGNGIKSITIDQANSDATKTTYIITFDNNSTYTYVVKNGTNSQNGEDGQDGSVVTIGANGNWYIDGEDTGILARGQNGSDGTNGQDGKDGNGIKSITIDQANSDATKTTYIITFDNNSTYTYVVKNGINGQNGEDGKDGSVVTIGEDGYWYIDGVKTDVKARGEDGTNGVDGEDAVIDTYTITYDYGVADTFFTGVKETETIKATQWLTTLPEIIDEYKESFLGWFISGTEKQITNYDFIGGNVTLEARFDSSKFPPSGLYKNGKYVKTWQSLIDDEYITVERSKISNVDGNLPRGELVIDDSIITIGMNEFWSCKLTSVTIPKSMTTIGTCAFANCFDLTKVTIPNSVTTIEGQAFSGCSSLTNVIIPSSVTKIENLAFLDCSGLKSINVEEGNTVYDSRNNCNAIIETSTNTLIEGCATTTIPNGIQTIGLQAFSGRSSLTNVIIPSSVTSIQAAAFSGCSSLTNIIIPNSVTTIGANILNNCASLKSIKVEEGNTVYDSRNNCNAIIETSTNTLIAGCATTTIPNGVTSIREQAFYGHSSLTSITIPNSVTTIGRHAFSKCSSLTNVIIPSSVTKIENLAFLDCDSLKSINVEEGNAVYDSRNNCNAIIETSTNTLIAGCATTIIPNDVTSIKDYAFYSCGSLTSITIPNSVTKIGDCAFEYCASLTEVTIESEIIANSLVEMSSNGYIIDRYYRRTVYIKTGLSVSNSTYLSENFTKQATSDKAGYDMYVKNS